jgi:2-aminoadipate transaminase
MGIIGRIIMLTDKFTYQLSQRASYLERSILRSLLKHAVNPNLISLAGGLPADEDLPTEQLTACMNAVLKRDGAAALQYSPPYAPLHEWIADYMTQRHVACAPENIFVTNGNQQGLAILSQLFLDEGATAVIEEAVFTGTQQGTKGVGAKVVTIPTDLNSGADVDALETALMNHDVRLVVLIPDFHNPLGVSINENNRRRVAELAARYAVPVVEDDAYSQLRFSGHFLPPIRAFDTAGYVFYLGSFSKMLAPGLRLGFMVIPEELRPKVTVIRESIDLETSTLIQRTVAECLHRGCLEPHIEKLRHSLKVRAEALMTALDKHLSDIATWTVPEGGLFSWCVLPEDVDTWELFDDALQAGVVYIPGGAFSVNGGHKNTMRLNFSRVAPEKFDEGIKRLSDVIRKHI